MVLVNTAAIPDTNNPTKRRQQATFPWGRVRIYCGLRYNLWSAMKWIMVMVRLPAYIQSHAQDGKHNIYLEWPISLGNYRGSGSRGIDSLDPCYVHKQVEKRIFIYVNPKVGKSCGYFVTQTYSWWTWLIYIRPTHWVIPGGYSFRVCSYHRRFTGCFSTSI